MPFATLFAFVGKTPVLHLARSIPYIRRERTPEEVNRVAESLDEDRWRQFWERIAALPPIVQRRLLPVLENVVSVAEVASANTDRGPRPDEEYSP